MIAIAAGLWFWTGIQAGNIHSRIIHGEPHWHVVAENAQPAPPPPGWTAMTVVRR